MIDPLLYEYLGSLSLTKDPSPVRGERACKLCGGRSPHFDQVDFHKSCDNLPLGRSGLLVEYFKCEQCDLLFTDFCDDWTTGDFARFIYNDQYILVDGEYTGARPKRIAEHLCRQIAGAEQARILDYGSGSGYLAREMAERGFRTMESYDPFAHPQRPVGQFDLITCNEVVEHSAWPRRTFEDILSLLAPGGIVLIGQSLQPPDIDVIRGDWWYIAPRNGHVSTYSRESFDFIARTYGLDFHDLGGLFAFSRPGRSDLSQRILAQNHPRTWNHMLYAPSDAEGGQDHWYSEEQADAGRFRWSRAPEVDLGTHHFPAGRCRVSVPYLMEIAPGFASGARIVVDGVEQPTILEEGQLKARFSIDQEGPKQVLLRTPQPLCPADLGLNPDDLRHLGLAIRVRG